MENWMKKRQRVVIVTKKGKEFKKIERLKSLRKEKGIFVAHK